MNATALQPVLGLVLAHARLYERLAESAIERRRWSDQRSLPERLASAISRFRRALTDPATRSTSTVPALTDYPYAP